MTTRKKKIETKLLDPETGQPIIAEVTMAAKKPATKKGKYTEAWAEIRVPVAGREIVLGAKAKMLATDNLFEAQENIFAECLENVNTIIDNLQKK